MEQIFFVNSLKKEFRTYVDIQIGKALKAISKQIIKAALLPVSFWVQGKFLYHAEFELNPHTHTSQGNWILQISIFLDSYIPKISKHHSLAHCVSNIFALH